MFTYSLESLKSMLAAKEAFIIHPDTNAKSIAVATEHVAALKAKIADMEVGHANMAAA